MNKVEGSTPVCEGDTLAEGIELGKWLGRRQAFGAMAGSCAAADVETLRRIREGKLYRKLDCTWAEYCAKHLHVSRRSVDRAIGYLEEFGPRFFLVAQMTHVAPRDYRLIAEAVGEDGIRVDGTVIALLPENSERISAAVAELLKRTAPAEAPSKPGAFDSALQKCRAIAGALYELTGLNGRQKLDLARAVAEIGKAAAVLGIAPGEGE